MKRKLESKCSNKQVTKRRKISHPSKKHYLGRLVQEKDLFSIWNCPNKSCDCAFLDMHYDYTNVDSFRGTNCLIKQGQFVSSLDRVYARPFNKHVFSETVFDKMQNIHIWSQFWIGDRSLFVFPPSMYKNKEQKSDIPLGGWCLTSARSTCPPTWSKLKNSYVECVIRWSLQPREQKKWNLVIGQGIASRCSICFKRSCKCKGQENKLGHMSYFPIGGWIQLAAIAWKLPGAIMPTHVFTLSRDHILKNHTDCTDKLCGIDHQ